MTVLATFDPFGIAEPHTLPGSRKSRSNVTNGSVLIDDDNSSQPSSPQSDPPRSQPPQDDTSDYSSRSTYEPPSRKEPTYQQPTYTQPTYTLPSIEIPSPLWFDSLFPVNPPFIATSSLVLLFTPSYPGEIFIGTEGVDQVAIERASRVDPVVTERPDWTELYNTIVMGVSGLSGTLLGFDGNDQLFGNDGNDFLQGGGNEDLLVGNSGNDVILGGSGNDTIHGGWGINSLYGNKGKDVIYGNIDAEQIQGGQGDDILRGYEGNDSLFGGQDQDLLVGDRGADRFILSAEFSPDRSKKADAIVDLKIGDSDQIFIIASFRLDEISYKLIEDYDGQVALSSEYAVDGWEFLTEKDSTAIVAPNGDILGVVFGVTDIPTIQNSITVVSTLQEAITL